MYNLLVSADPQAWDHNDFVLDLPRYLEYTDEDLRAQYSSLDERTCEELTALPTLFAYEKIVAGDARVGWIKTIERAQSDVRITFQFDAEIPPIPAHKVESLARDLRIAAYEMNRTHWAVKKVDLLAVLNGHETASPAVPPYRRKTVAAPATALGGYLPSELLGRFEVLQHLGSGGFAAVYQVLDVESQQRFALKVLNNTPEARARAGREVAAAALSHRHILTVVEHHPAGHWFLLPLAEGTLGQLHWWKRLNAYTAMEVAISVGRALSYAHSAGFLHRDIHPDNIVRHDGDWKVTDWGLAAAPDRKRLTRTRSVGGTDVWTAPEQLRSLTNADVRSDLFGLGRIVQWLVTGEPPDPTLPGNVLSHPLAKFVNAATRLDPSERPQTVDAALLLIPDPTEQTEHQVVREAVVLPLHGGESAPSDTTPQPAAKEKPSGAEVELAMAFNKKRITQDHHDYELVVALTNVSRRRIDDWELEVEFPTPLLGDATHTIKVADRSDAETSLFRIDRWQLGKPLRPGDTQSIRLGYFVNREIFWNRQELFQRAAKARALVDGQIVVELDRLAGQLQDF